MDAHLCRTNQKSPHDSNTLTAKALLQTSVPSEDQPYTSRGLSDAGKLGMKLRSRSEATEYTVIWSQTLGGSSTSPVTDHFPCQAVLIDDNFSIQPSELLLEGLRMRTQRGTSTIRQAHLVSLPMPPIFLRQHRCFPQSDFNEYAHQAKAEFANIGNSDCGKLCACARTRGDDLEHTGQPKIPILLPGVVQ